MKSWADVIGVGRSRVLPNRLLSQKRVACNCSFSLCSVTCVVPFSSRILCYCWSPTSLPTLFSTPFPMPFCPSTTATALRLPSSPSRSGGVLVGCLGLLGSLVNVRSSFEQVIFLKHRLLDSSCPSSQTSAAALFSSFPDSGVT